MYRASGIIYVVAKNNVNGIYVMPAAVAGSGAGASTASTAPAASTTSTAPGGGNSSSSGGPSGGPSQLYTSGKATKTRADIVTAGTTIVRETDSILEVHDGASAGGNVVWTKALFGGKRKARKSRK
jgi:hypothetical protein